MTILPVSYKNVTYLKHKMGMKQSIYESGSIQDYYKLSSEEYSLIKQLWTEIENKPQYYGNLFFTSFLGTYPEYIKYYTLNPRLPLSVDVRLTAKFTVIMEAIGYLMLDVYRNRKQLDRLVGYVAMVHKDMRLDKRDMTNFETSFLRYLALTFPTKMTGKCQEAITKYFSSIVNGIVNKMEQFREYEITEAETSPQSSFGRCTLCTDNLVFGQNMTYWKERKKDWDMLLDEWDEENSSLEPWVSTSFGNDTLFTYKSKTEDEETVVLPESKEKRDEKRDEDFAEPIKDEGWKAKLKDENAEMLDKLSLEQSHLENNNYEESSEATNPWTSPTWDPIYMAGTSPRERYRAHSIVREAIDPQSDPRILRRRMRSSRMVVRPSIGRIIKQDNEETEVRHVGQRKFTNTARERRRESQQFSFDLK